MEDKYNQSWCRVLVHCKAPASFLMAVSASAVAVFLCTTAPSRALPFTMQYGTAGRAGGGARLSR